MPGWYTHPGTGVAHFRDLEGWGLCKVKSREWHPGEAGRRCKKCAAKAPTPD